jgi:hypothetical protein
MKGEGADGCREVGGFEPGQTRSFNKLAFVLQIGALLLQCPCLPGNRGVFARSDGCDSHRTDSVAEESFRSISPIYGNRTI